MSNESKGFHLKTVAVLFSVVLFMSVGSVFAQAPSPSPAPVSAPVAAVTSPQPVPAVVKDESMAPPVFMQDIVVQAKALPFVGPYIVKIGQGLLILLTLLTALTTCVVSVLSALKGVSGAAGLDSLNDKVVALQNSKVVYWLKYASLVFNAQKPAADQPKADEPAAA
jgi:hypothetical protein